MKKILLFSLLFASILIGCGGDDSSPTAPATTPSNPNYTNPSTNPGTTTPSNTTPSNLSYTVPTTTVLYDVMMGGVCKAVTVNTGSSYTGTNANGCQNDTYNSINALYSNCDMSLMHVTEYDNLTLDRIRTMLINDFSFDTNTASSIYGQAASCGVAFFVYNAVSGLNFLYIERVGDGIGLVKKAAEPEKDYPSEYKYVSGLEVGSIM